MEKRKKQFNYREFRKFILCYNSAKNNRKRFFNYRGQEVPTMLAFEIIADYKDEGKIIGLFNDKNLFYTNDVLN